MGDLPDRPGGEMRMCDACADAMTAPVGWDKRDVREPSPRLFVVQPGDLDPEQAPLRPRTSGGPQRSLIRRYSCMTLRTRVRCGRPSPPRTDTPLGTLLDPHSPLLARAFRGARYS